MATKIKSIRLDTNLLERLDDYINSEEKQFNRVVIEALTEYLDKYDDKTTTIGQRNYYPIHLTNDELVIIINDFMKNIENEYNCSVKVRKDKGGKGIDFQINFYQEFKNKVIKKKRYSFSLNPYWRLEEILEHRNNSENFICERLNILDSSIVLEIANYNVSRKSTLELNSIFKDERWKVLFERKFPILKHE